MFEHLLITSLLIIWQMALLVTGPRNVHTFTCRKFTGSYVLHESSDAVHVYIISRIKITIILWKALIVRGLRDVHTFIRKRLPESYVLHESSDVVRMYIISPVRDLPASYGWQWSKDGFDGHIITPTQTAGIWWIALIIIRFICVHTFSFVNYQNLLESINRQSA
jgi:hypothetical protein